METSFGTRISWNADKLSQGQARTTDASLRSLARSRSHQWEDYAIAQLCKWARSKSSSEIL
jgi:hypothetical protein